MEPFIDEILAVIDRVDRRGDHTLLPTRDTPHDRFDELVEQVAAPALWLNITEFEYGRSWRYFIAMTDDKDTVSLRRELVEQYVRRAGTLEEVHLAISAIAPYYRVRFSRYRSSDGDILHEWADAAFTPEQQRAADKLGSLLASEGYNMVSPASAAMRVPDVSTDLCDEGEATIADCLFFG